MHQPNFFKDWFTLKRQGTCNMYCIIVYIDPFFVTSQFFILFTTKEGCMKTLWFSIGCVVFKTIHHSFNELFNEGLLGKLKLWDAVKKNVKLGIALTPYRKHLSFSSPSCNPFNLPFFMTNLAIQSSKQLQHLLFLCIIFSV